MTPNPAQPEKETKESIELELFKESVAKDPRQPQYVLIFGAGASYGSMDRKIASNLESLPPLGNDLFGELLKHDHETWEGVANAFSGVHFEQGWMEVKRRYDNDFRCLLPYQRSMTRYFNQFHLNQENFYKSYYFHLARCIATTQEQANQPWNGTIVTMNYESMLQEALAIAGIRFFINDPDLAWQDPQDKLELCVPHGFSWVFADVRMLNRFNVPILQSDYRDKSIEVFNTEPTLVPDPEEIEEKLASDDWVPVLSYYDPLKNAHICQDFLTYQCALYMRRVEEASTVVIIGLSCNSADSHIWQSLAATDAMIYYVEPTDAGPFERWAEHAGKKSGQDYEIIPKTFFDASVEVWQHLDLTWS
jgi:hypothetical protein